MEALSDYRLSECLCDDLDVSNSSLAKKYGEECLATAKKKS